MSGPGTVGQTKGGWFGRRRKEVVGQAFVRNWCQLYRSWPPMPPDVTVMVYDVSDFRGDIPERWELSDVDPDDLGDA